jgi:uncharacterized membrane protein
MLYTTSYLVWRWLHIVSVVIAGGSTITFSIWLMRSMGDQTKASFTLRTIRGIVNFLTVPAAILILIFGATMSHIFPLSVPWHMIGFILYLILVVLVLAYSLLVNREAGIVEKEGPKSPRFVSGIKGIVSLGTLNILIVVAIGFFMVVKPTLWG